MKIFGKTNDVATAEARLTELNEQLKAAEADYTTTRTAIGEALAAGQEVDRASRDRIARAGTRREELRAALPVAEARVTRAREAAAAAVRQEHFTRAQRAAQERLRLAHKVDRAISQLGVAWNAYEAATVEVQQALRAAGEDASSVSHGLHRRGLSALWAGARGFCRRLHLVRPNHFEPLAQNSIPDASPGDGEAAESSTPAVA